MAIPEEIRNYLKRQFGERVRFDEPMSLHTTFKIGGPADAYVMPADEQELAALMKWLLEKGVPMMVMGKGSNLLVKDRGVRGVVISLTEGFKAIASVENLPSSVRVRVEAGAKLAALCRYALQHRLSGMNFALGIPGSVGGAILMNAGAAGGAMQSVVESVKIMRINGITERLDRSAMKWTYRGFSVCRDNKDTSGNYIILSGDFLFVPGEAKSLRASAKKIARERKAVQPTRFPSAGCFFKNPQTGDPAGKLIDLSGLKGFRVGDAEVSAKHANFIVNRGRASARDVLEVSDMIRETVYQKFQVKLMPEVKIIGE